MNRRRQEQLEQEAERNAAFYATADEDASEQFWQTVEEFWIEKRKQDAAERKTR